MSHTTTYNSEEHVIETRSQGDLSLNEAREIISEIVQTAKETGCFLCISDYRESKLSLSTLEIYDVPKLASDISTSHGLSARNFKRAIVVKEDMANFHFFETVTLNSGQNIRLFHDIDEAKKWLFD